MTGLAATAEVRRFEEAWTWFQQRFPVTREMRDQMQDYAAQRAWWVSGTQHLDVVIAAHAEISNAIDLGTPPHELVKRLEKLLPNLTKARLATIARTNLHSAFNAGRWQQMVHPDQLELRPFWKFDSILDFRTTDGCRDLDGTALPAGDPFWTANWPPRHFQCRSQVRAIKPRDFERLPKDKRQEPQEYQRAQPGFGLPPDIQMPWRPDLGRVQPELRAIFDDKAAKHEAAQAKAAAAERERRKRHTPEHWLEEYTARYGSEAALPLARGRASLEAGLDERAADVLAELRRLGDAQVTGLPTDRITDLLQANGTKTVRELLEGRSKDNAVGRREIGDLNAAAAIVGHSRVVNRKARKLPHFKKGAPKADAAQRLAEAFFNELAGRSVQLPEKWTFRYGTVHRSVCRVFQKVIELATGREHHTLVHEIGHALEAINPALGRRARAFLEARTAGEELNTLRNLAPGYSYDPEEMAKEDRFFDPYMGKIYGHEATEITSMLAEALSKDAGKLGRQDLESLLFVLGQLLEA